MGFVSPYILSSFDAVAFFPLFSMRLIFCSLESRKPIDKVPEYVKICNTIVLYNASAASDVRLFLIFLIMFSLLAAFLQVFSKCVASVKVGSKCTPRYSYLVVELMSFPSTRISSCFLSSKLNLFRVPNNMDSVLPFLKFKIS